MGTHYVNLGAFNSSKNNIDKMKDSSLVSMYDLFVIEYIEET